MVQCCKDRNIDKVIHLGDLFHNRRSICVKTIDVASKIIKTITLAAELVLLCGNHDSFYSTSILPSSLNIFNEYYNVNLVFQPQFDTHNKNIIYVPWLDEDIYSYKNVPIVMGHFDINGFPLNESQIKSTNFSLDTSDFIENKMVLSGHYHTPSKSKNINYLGAPFQHNFGDIGQKRGYYIFDDESLELEFIEFTRAAKYVIIFHKDLDKLKEEEIKGNNVKLIFEGEVPTVEANLILDTIYNMNPLSVFVEHRIMTMDVDGQGESWEKVNLKRNEEVLFEYIDKLNHPKHIKNKLVKSFTEKLLCEDNEN